MSDADTFNIMFGNAQNFYLNKVNLGPEPHEEVTEAMILLEDLAARGHVKSKNLLTSFYRNIPEYLYIDDQRGELLNLKTMCLARGCVLGDNQSEIELKRQGDTDNYAYETATKWLQTKQLLLNTPIEPLEGKEPASVPHPFKSPAEQPHLLDRKREYREPASVVPHTSQSHAVGNTKDIEHKAKQPIPELSEGKEPVGTPHPSKTRTAATTKDVIPEAEDTYSDDDNPKEDSPLLPLSDNVPSTSPSKKAGSTLDSFLSKVRLKLTGKTSGHGSTR
jgi:hypothetical protein